VRVCWNYGVVATKPGSLMGLRLQLLEKQVDIAGRHGYTECDADEQSKIAELSHAIDTVIELVSLLNSSWSDVASI